MQDFKVMWRGSLFLLLLLSVVSGLKAQNNVVAPYSRFGVGHLYNEVYSTQRGMGGVGTFMIEAYKLNPTNPASYAYVLEPVFSVGIDYKAQTLKTTNSTIRYNHGRPFNFALGLPLERGRWGMAFGISPYSSAGYDLTVDNSGIEQVPHQVKYSGDGGINRAFLGTGYRIVNDVDSLFNATTLSAGLEVGYYFGTLNFSSRTIFPLTSTALGKRFTTSRSFKDVRGKLGLQYQTNLIKRTKNDPRYLKLLSGVKLERKARIATKFQQIGESFTNNTTGTENPIDTLSNTGTVEGNTTFPFSMDVGVGLDYVTHKRLRLQGGLQYSFTHWRQYQTTAPGFNADAQNLQDVHELSLGVELTPDQTSFKYFEKVEYRAGFRVANSYINLRNQSIDEYGISFGLSLPINAKRNLTQSMFNIGVEYGQRGTTDYGLIQENYWRMQVGFTLTPHVRNLWLKQKKYR